MVMSKAKKISVLNYAFAIGRIRELENFLIKREVFEQTIEIDLNEALRLFVESDLYSEELLHVKNSQELEEVLKKELLKLKKLMSDLLLDKGLLGLIEDGALERMRKVLISYPSEFLKDYIMHLTDMHNIKSFLRLYLLKEPVEKLKITLTSEGFIKRDDFLRLYEADLALFLNRLEYVHKHNQIIDYAYFLKEAIKKLEKENSFVYLEKAIDDFLIEVLRPAKYLSLGPEPLLAYYFAKVNEINLIRMIILAKFNAVSLDLVSERLNQVYA